MQIESVIPGYHVYSKLLKGNIHNLSTLSDRRQQEYFGGNYMYCMLADNTKDNGCKEGGIFV